MSESTPEKKVYIKTFGCQMNEYDSGKMRALLGQDGYVSVEDPEQADVILVNTCSVREKPEHKLHSFIGEVKHLRKQGVRIGIAGCMAQYDGERLFHKYRRDVTSYSVRIKSQDQGLVARAGKGGSWPTPLWTSMSTPLCGIWIPCETSTGPSSPSRRAVTTSAPLHCASHTRVESAAPLRRSSRRFVRAARGIREITLIGQNVNSYGLKVGNERTFAELLYAVAEQPGVERIRYTTSHPRDMGPDVVQAYRDLPQLTSHLHLPVQSGSSRVLRRMKRFYTREHYLKLVEDLKAARPNLSLTTDIIVGFPGETEEDFEATMSLLEEVRFDASFSFKYSPRPGTPALKLEKDAVPPEVASERLSSFQARQRVIQIEENHALEMR